MSRRNLAAVLASPPATAAHARLRAAGPVRYTLGDPIVMPHRLEKSRRLAPQQRGAERLAKWLGLRADAGNLEIFVACENQRCAHAFADRGEL
jgi:hypothetical protein